MTRLSPRPTPGPLRRLRARRGRLMASAACGAVALLASVPEPARAQAVNGTPAVVGGSALIDRSVPGRDTVTVTSNSAIINWIPPNIVPNPYIFLPQNTLLTFQNGASNPNFAVLNRILASVPSRFEGSVLSQLQIGSGLTTRGGTVFFSSPGGIIIGSTARFDVGNLVLTSLNVVDDGTPSGNFINPVTGRYVLNGGGLQPNAGVIVEAGAIITATAENSYVALIAPRVDQGGLIDVNGSAAFIAADALEFSVSQGLFDIIVTSGSDNAIGITHTGTTGGPASGGIGDNHNIYAVAVGRNQAIRMLLQGNMGYSPATTASVDNGGAILLSAGYNVTGGVIGGPALGTAADIELADGSFTSNVVGRATGDATATATLADPLSFTGSLSLEAVGPVAFVTDPGTSVSVGTGATLIGATVDVDSILVGGGLFASSTGTTVIDNADAASILVSAGGAATLGTLVADSNIDVTAASISLANGNAVADIVLSSPGDINVLLAQVGDDFIATAGGNFTGGTIVTTGLGPDGDSDNPLSPLLGSNIRLTVAGTVVAGTLNAFDDIVVDPTSITIDVAVAGADIVLDATGPISVNSADAGDDFIATAGTSFTGGTVIARGLKDNDSSGPLVGGNIDIDAGTDLRLDNGDAANAIRLASSSSILSDGLLDAGTDLDADAEGDILITVANAGRDVSLTAGTDILLASSTAGDDFVATADGTFNATTVNAGTGADSEGGLGALAGGNIQVTTSGDLQLDNGNAANAIRLASSAGNVVGTGLLDAGTDLDVDAAGEILLASLDAGADVTLDAGAAILLSSGSAGDDFVAIAGGTFTAGTVTATGLGPDSEGASGSLAGGNILVASAGELRLDNGTAPEVIELASSGGSILSNGTLRADSLVANAALDLRLRDVFVVTDLALSAVNGDITGNNFNSDGDIILDASDEVVLNRASSGGDISIVAGANLRLNNGFAPGLIDLASSTGSIFSAGTLDTGQLFVDSAVDIRLTNVFVDTDLVLLAPGGAISGNLFDSPGNILLDAATTVTLASADSGGSILVTGGGDVRLDRGRADGAITLTSTGGSVFSDPLGGGGGGDGSLPPGDGLLDAGTDVILTAAVDVTIDDARAGDTIFIDAGRNTTVRNLTAAQSVDVDAVGNATFNGAARAPTIAVASADIDIASGGSLGDSATQLVSLTVVPDARLSGQQTVLGGSAEGPAYTLTDAEADRITAATLRVDAPPAGTAADRPADILVRDLSLAGAQVGLFDLRTTGIVQVEGGLLLSGVRAGGGIEIRATERIQLVNPSGSVRVRDGAGLTDGNLLLSSNNVWSASQGLLDQLRADPNFAGRDQALLVNDGPVAPRGYIEAGDVVLAARDTLFVQNSGGVIAFAGITVRESTLRILPTGSLPLKVFAFGRRINPDGSFVTNNAFFGEVVFEGRGGPVGYAEDAQFNLCFINSGVCRLPIGNPVPGGPDIVEEPVDGSDTTTTLQLGREELVDTSFADEPLIEEPVTSGSDSILWDCDRDDDGDCDEEDNDG